jgi:DNA end-binding protein Ku
MPTSRVIWKGAISFGLVNVAVQLYPATRAERASFNLIDKETADPIGYKQINKRTGKEVKRENIVRGYEYEKGQYVLLADEEIRSASPESTQTVDILAFVEAYSVSFLYLDTPYYLVPERQGKKAYALLREALAQTGKIGIANVVLHNKQHLAALIPAGPVLALNTLRWGGEVLPIDESMLPPVDAKKAGVAEREIEMAKKLIEDMTEPWDPTEYHNTFREDILALVDKKVREGKTREISEAAKAPARTRETADVVDLSELLKRSLGRGKGKHAPTVDPIDGGKRRACLANSIPIARSGNSTERRSLPAQLRCGEPATGPCPKTPAVRGSRM